jgi:hypothetical protein
MNARWSDDFTSAVLFCESGDLKGWLHLGSWYGRGERDAGLAWFVAFLDPDAERPMSVREEVEYPAAAADTPRRRAELADRAAAVIRAGPSGMVDPPATGAPEMSAWARSELLDRILTAWEKAHNAFTAACALGTEGDFERWRTLTQLLLWTYTLDEALQATWNAVPLPLQVAASNETDEHARRAISHNRRLAATHGIEWDEQTDPALEAYRRRKDRGGRPYEHWSSLLLAGRFGERFFQAMQWVRAQATHVGIATPIELRQLRPGEPPRWKWKRAAVFAMTGREASGAKLYDRELGEQDVVGLFSWLRSVFFDAKHLLIRLMRETENAADEIDTEEAHL